MARKEGSIVKKEVQGRKGRTNKGRIYKKEDKSKNKSIVKRHLHAPDNYVPRSLFNLSAVVRQREQERDKQTASVILFFKQQNFTPKISLTLQWGNDRCIMSPGCLQGSFKGVL